MRTLAPARQVITHSTMYVSACYYICVLILLNVCLCVCVRVRVCRQSITPSPLCVRILICVLILLRMHVCEWVSGWVCIYARQGVTHFTMCPHTTMCSYTTIYDITHTTIYYHRLLYLQYICVLILVHICRPFTGQSPSRHSQPQTTLGTVLSSLALLVQKYKYWRSYGRHCVQHRRLGASCRHHRQYSCYS